MSDPGKEMNKGSLRMNISTMLKMMESSMKSREIERYTRCSYLALDPDHNIQGKTVPIQQAYRWSPSPASLLTKRSGRKSRQPLP